MHKLRFETARAVFDAFPTLGEEISARPSDAAPFVFLRARGESATPEEAIPFAAHMLARREAVWWLCTGLRRLLPGGDGNASLAAAETWVREPSEAHRVAAMDLAMASDHKNPATWAAMAAAWSGGNLALGDYPGAPAPPHLAAKAVSAGYFLALAPLSSGERRDTIRALVEESIRIASTDTL